MKVKEVSVGKEFKVGLENYSNITVRCDLKYEVSDTESVNWDECWDEVNRQLNAQSSGIDPSWITTKEYNKYFKVLIKIPKDK